MRRKQKTGAIQAPPEPQSAPVSIYVTGEMSDALQEYARENGFKTLSDAVRSILCNLDPEKLSISRRRYRTQVACRIPATVRDKLYRLAGRHRITFNALAVAALAHPAPPPPQDDSLEPPVKKAVPTPKTKAAPKAVSAPKSGATPKTKAAPKAVSAPKAGKSPIRTRKAAPPPPRPQKEEKPARAKVPPRAPRPAPARTPPKETAPRPARAGKRRAATPARTP
ncbi:MAG: hypothetical protein LBG65_00635 [Puniceicoccales bacterium]|jgi:hypothetical protein|nr:hypothetical protein [Puniceicoccales bacterium]